MQKGKLKVQACTAVARELAGFIWAIGREIMGKNAIPIVMGASSNDVCNYRTIIVYQGSGSMNLFLISGKLQI